MRQSHIISDNIITLSSRLFAFFLKEFRGNERPLAVEQSQGILKSQDRWVTEGEGGGGGEGVG